MSVVWTSNKFLLLVSISVLHKIFQRRAPGLWKNVTLNICRANSCIDWNSNSKAQRHMSYLCNSRIRVCVLCANTGAGVHYILDHNCERNQKPTLEKKTNLIKIIALCRICTLHYIIIRSISYRPWFSCNPAKNIYSIESEWLIFKFCIHYLRLSTIFHVDAFAHD